MYTYTNSLKELRVADFEKKNNIYDHLKGFISSDDKILLLGYQLTGAQLFIKNLFNPNTLYKRLLINWQTGVGKSIAAISIGNEFIKFFQEQYVIKRVPQMVCILGFNTTETIKADMLKFPELGYVTEAEIKELNRLLVENDPRHTQFSAMLNRRISDKITGGFYRFYGYREFVNNLFVITDKGINNKITYQEIFATSEEESKLEEFISKNYIRVNYELLNSLKNGIIICDEIHNVYNSMEANNYGSAIQYVLNVLKNEAPRAVFMSATPLTGNASEITDLLNLLNPGMHLKRSDYFYKDSDGIFQLKSNSIEEITRLTIGKVSFLIDTDIDLYPKRIFDGNTINKIPYLKLLQCNMSEYHNNTVKQEENLTYAQQTRTLYDIAFPNPDSNDYGLYNSSIIFSKLQKAPLEWRNKVGIDTYVDNGISVITGDFLKQENIKKYSIKYHTLLVDVIDNIKNKIQGKIMVFHYNVQLSGVILLQELFKMNGFIDESSEPNNSTLCVICGISLVDHDEKKEDHIFKPCRFIIAHSNINKMIMKRNIAKFNDKSNLYGTEIKMIIGSRIIQEGLNFKAVRYQYILTLPINFPILIQVLGRVVRKFSHLDLPEDQRDVHIRIYAHDIELPRYIYKATEYLVIQEVERAIRINAVDNFMNYKKLSTTEDSLESLKFRPMNIDKPSISTKFFDAYNYNDDEINIIKKILSILFKIRPVWTFDDIIESIHNFNINYNTSLIDNNNIELAISKMNNIHHIENFYIYSTDLDIECFFRKKIINPIVDINITQYYSKTSFDRLYHSIMLIYEEKYLNAFIELSLVDLPKSFHIELLKKIVEGNVKNNKIIELYKRFKILLLDKNESIIGYIDNISSNLYDKSERTWYNKSHEEYNIGRRYDENKYLIGYVIEEGGDTKLKLRDPILSNRYSDLRTVRKGMVCENNIREDLIDILSNLRKLNDIKSYAYKYDQSISKGSTIELCKIIKLYLLSFEEKNRNLANGMKNSIRWLYLFHDILPNISLK